MSRPDLFCLYCRNKASKGPKCIKCDRVFHPKCVERLNIEVIDDEQVICCTGMEEKSDDVLEFLKSEEFSELEIKIQRSRDDGGYSNTNSSKLKTTIPSKNLTTRREQQKDLIDVGPKKLRDNNSTVKTADFDIEKVERDNDRSSNGWIQVQSKRRINKKWSGVRGKANTEKSSGLTAANRKAYIYAGNFENSTKEEDVKDYLSKIFPNETIEQLQEAIFNGNLNQVDKIIAETLAIQWNRIELLAQENSEELNRSDELVQVAKIRKLNKNVITTGRFDRNETTPLTAAILSGKLDEAKVLLEEGTDSCKADSNQQTPLLAAVRSKSLEAVRLLLHYGANLTIPTAFLEAINLNCSEIVKYFIENGADVNKQYRDGFTPLTKAIDNGNVKIVKVLLNSGADVNLANDEGETPLRIATNKRSIFIVYLLVEKGADMDLAREDLEEFAEDDEDFYTYYQNLQMNNSNSWIIFDVISI
ncbi:hypothetical protein TcasGA2_TC006832 [Tribolium castaneum]|uniref:Uncharacterized protein n=1 Tax=Tribolium castaneum TaxID=7070 RepID=D7EI16_TRICA|nr:hypothetical protein TcasGA2_TC006832 [Tribolium castaneum]